MAQQPARRRKKKKRSRILKPIRYILALAAVIIGIGVFFKVSNIQVEGNVIYSEEDIKSAAGLKEGKSLFFAERRAAEHNIYKVLARIDKVSVKLRAPDTIVIEVVESKADACLEYNGQYLILNRSCKVIGTAEQASNAVITGLAPLEASVGSVIKVADEDKTKLAYISELLTLFEEKGMINEVGSIDISNVTDLKFSYQDRLTVRMGGYEKIEYKLEFLSTIIENRSPGDRGTVDLTTDMEGHYIPE
jgi:cell division septal protein FtsQ